MRYFSCASALALLSFTSSVVAQNPTPTDLAQPCQHKPVWQTCQGVDPNSRLECATIKVARNWAKKDGQEILMRLIRYKAINNPDTAKSIIMNPGGPGESEIQYIRLGGGADLGQKAGNNFHIVGFDPRGVGQNMPYNCNSGTTLPSNNDIYQSYADGYSNHAQDCYNAVDKDLGSLINTIQTAKDVVAISEAVNSDARIRYWGFSYGTLLGNVIARLVPSRIEAMILDGNVNPNSYYYTNGVEKSTDTDNSIKRFFALCAEAGSANCGWKAPDNQDFTYANLIAKWENWVGADPSAPNRGRTDPNGLTETQSSWVRYNVFRAMYQPRFFTKLGQILQYWFNDKGQIPTSLINFETYEVPAGAASAIRTNITEPSRFNLTRRQSGIDPNYDPATIIPSVGVIDGISCVDTQFHPASSSAVYRDLYTAYDQSSKYAGDAIVGGPATCIPWKFRPTEQWTDPDRWAASGQIKTDKPILFVQTQFDPITPQISGDSAKSYYVGARIVKTNGEGHCSAAHTSQTLNVALRQYWNSGTMPNDNTIYAVVNPNPFTGPPLTQNFPTETGTAPVLPDDGSLGKDFIALRGADMSHLFEGLHVPKKRSSKLEHLFDGLHYIKRDVDTDIEYGVCDEDTTSTTSSTGTASTSTMTGTATASATGTATTTTTSQGYSTWGTSKPVGATDTWSSWATYVKWTSTKAPGASTWSTWNPKPTTWNTWSPKTDGWEAWTSQDNCIPVTKTIAGMTKVVAVPTKTVYIEYIDDVCETGITTKVITVTATCTKGCETKPTGVPQGYTTTGVYCGACATPSTVIVTVKDAAWSPVPATPVKASDWSAVPATPVKSAEWSPVATVPVKPAEWSPAATVPVKPAATESWSPVGKYTGAASTVSITCGSIIAAFVATLLGLAMN